MIPKRRRAPAAAAQTALDQGANILLGPVFAAHAKIVGPVAATAHVPVIAFTTDKSVAGPGSTSWAFCPACRSSAM